jgi:hypothetical protein
MGQCVVSQKLPCPLMPKFSAGSVRCLTSHLDFFGKACSVRFLEVLDHIIAERTPEKGATKEKEEEETSARDAKKEVQSSLARQQPASSARLRQRRVAQQTHGCNCKWHVDVAR